MSDAATYALFSGGHDSLVSTHKAMESGRADGVVHIDTGIGIPETKEFVKETCDEHGWELKTVSSDHDYEDIVVEEQFPGPAVHIIMYSKLKERALRNVARWHDHKPVLITGVRKDESERRFRNVEGRVEAGMWIWEANIADWSQSDVDAYIDDHDLRRSPVKQTYHHSGECLCGAFGNRTEELAVLEAHYPKTADRIKDLEQKVQDEHGNDDPKSYWAHGNMDERKLSALLAENDDAQMMLCASCSNGFKEME
jgi:3'-phosphoadenosine 5'-phosphosulfate sulfotransferase (PAPS reductase)/FAD synthetase